MIDLKIISTGSKGNAVFLNGQVLIDCGVPYSKLVAAKVVDDIQYVFLTHQHKDHMNIATICKLLSNRPSVKLIYPSYLCNPLYKACVTRDIDCSFLINNSFILTMQKWYKICNIQFSCVPLHHDVPNVAWKIYFQQPQGIYKTIYATDTANMDGVTAQNYDLYLIECNYTKKDIVQRIKEKRLSGQYVYEERVLKTHLSEDKCNDFIFSNIGPNGRYVYLHSHEDKDTASDDNSSTDSQL